MPAEDAGSVYSQVRVDLATLKVDLQNTSNLFDAFAKENEAATNKITQTQMQKWRNAMVNVGGELQRTSQLVKAGAVTEEQAIQVQIAARKRLLAVLTQNATARGQFTNEEIAQYKKINFEVQSLTARYQQMGKGGSASLSTFAMSVAGLTTGFGLLAQIAQKVLQTLGEMAVGSIKNAAAFEDTSAAWEVLAGSYEKGIQTVKTLQDWAARTPYAFSNADKVAQTVKGMGVELEKIPEVLDKLGNVAKGNGEKFEQLGLVYGQVKAQGKAMTQDLYQFVNAGVPIFELLAKSMGKPSSAIKDLAAANKITFTEIDKALTKATTEGGDFYGMMDKASKTFNGQMSTLRDNFKMLSTDIGGTFLPILKWYVSGINDLFTMIDQNKKKARMEDVIEGWKKLSPEERKAEQNLVAYHDALVDAIAMDEKAIASGKYRGAQLDEIDRSLQGYRRSLSGIAIAYGRTETAAARMHAEMGNKTEDANAASLKALAREMKALQDQHDKSIGAIAAARKIWTITAEDASAKELAALDKQIEGIGGLISKYADELGAMPETNAKMNALIEKRKQMALAIGAEKQAIIDANAAKTDERNSEASRYKQYNDIDHAITEVTKSMDEQQKKLDARTVSDNKGLEAERQKLLEQADAWEAMGFSVDELRLKINKLYDTMEAPNPKKALEEMRRLWNEVGDAMKSIATSVADIVSASIQKEIDDLTYRYELEKELIENNGKTKLQALEDELAAAKASGDEEKIAEAKKNLDLYKAEQEYEKKKAKLQYEADLAQWEAKLITAQANAAMAIMNVWADSGNGPFWVRLAQTGLVGGAVAAETVALVKAKPEPPKFNTGGIVTASSSGNGTPIIAGDGGGADILFGTSAAGSPLMHAFAQLVADKISSGGEFHSHLYLDSQQIAESVARRVRNGQVSLE